VDRARFLSASAFLKQLNPVLGPGFGSGFGFAKAFDADVEEALAAMAESTDFFTSKLDSMFM